MNVSQAHELTTVLDAMADGIYIVNDNHVVEFMNKSMIRVFGDGVGKKMPPGDQPYPQPLSLVPVQGSLRQPTKRP